MEQKKIVAGKTARDLPRVYLVLSPLSECLKRAMKLKECSFTGLISTTAIFFDGQSIHSLLFQPLYNGHLSTMATFSCPQGGRCKEVQL